MPGTYYCMYLNRVRDDLMGKQGVGGLDELHKES